MPVVLPPCVSDLESLIARLDGVCLSGGPDLDPEAYGARERHAELGPTEPSLDAFELALARAALERGMPLLGICRGAQALNVACGGTLHQHLPGHRQSEPGCQVTHEVEVLRRHAAGRADRRRRRTRVNSFHHQAVDRSAAGCGSPPAPPTARSRRSRAPGFASACSGTPRRSPTGACSRRS